MIVFANSDCGIICRISFMDYSVRRYFKITAVGWSVGCITTARGDHIHFCFGRDRLNRLSNGFFPHNCATISESLSREIVERRVVLNNAIIPKNDGVGLPSNTSLDSRRIGNMIVEKSQ